MRVRNSSGDTIVEVLIVLAVLSLAFAISYATANRGLARAQNANEHSVALGLINSQVELVRSSYARGINLAVPTTPSPFCLKPDGSVLASNDPACTTAGAQNYQVQITHHAPAGQLDYFAFRITWPGVGSLGPQQEELTYTIQ